MLRECEEWEEESSRRAPTSVERALKVWRARKNEEKRLERRYQAASPSFPL
jgi:hypothetical protein